MTQAIKRIWKATGSLRVTTKLMAAFGVMLALTIVVSFEGIHAASLLEESSKSLFTRDLTGISAIKEAGVFQVKCTRVLRDIVLARGDKDAIGDQREVLIEMESSVDEWTDAAQKAFNDGQSQVKLTKLRQEMPKMRSISKEVAELALAGDQKAAIAKLKETNSIGNHINLEIAEICRTREEAAKQSREQSEATFKHCERILFGCAIFSTIFAMALGLLTIRLIARPLTRVMATLQMASQGDLTQRLVIDSNDEIGRMGSALNEAFESIRTVLENVSDTARDLGTFSVELAGSAEGLAKGSREQANGLEETSAALEEITVTARHNADHARKASKVSSESWQTAQDGQGVVTGSVKAMDEINESSEKISQIASAVDEVAFQTNLLAVNAAIEAARAGEHGESFAVVAAEIRSLSQRSGESANDIRKLIKESLRTVKKGTVSISKSGQTLQSLVSSVNEVTNFVTQIVTASEEQSKGVESVHTAILRMDSVTQTNAARAAQLSTTATTLSSQAQNLQAMLERFTLKAGEAVQG